VAVDDGGPDFGFIGNPLSSIGVGDQPVVDQGEFVAEAFEALPHRHLLIRF
jgi:hypothetical protein